MCGLKLRRVRPTHGISLQLFNIISISHPNPLSHSSSHSHTTSFDIIVLLSAMNTVGTHTILSGLKTSTNNKYHFHPLPSFHTQTILPSKQQPCPNNMSDQPIPDHTEAKSEFDDHINNNNLSNHHHTDTNNKTAVDSHNPSSSSTTTTATTTTDTTPFTLPETREIYLDQRLKAMFDDVKNQKRDLEQRSRV